MAGAGSCRWRGKHRLRDRARLSSVCQMVVHNQRLLLVRHTQAEHARMSKRMALCRATTFGSSDCFHPTELRACHRCSKSFPCKAEKLLKSTVLLFSSRVECRLVGEQLDLGFRVKVCDHDYPVPPIVLIVTKPSQAVEADATPSEILREALLYLTQAKVVFLVIVPSY